jgi:protein-S-isoprenylcysteine O-methyltransferase Ste14
MPGMLKISTCLSFLFLFSELILLATKHSRKKESSKQKDRGSLIILWIIIAIGLTLGFMLAKYDTWHPVNYLIATAGIIMVLIGFAFRWTAIFQLNKSFTVDVAVSSDQELKRDGLYRIVRHPSYLGLLLFMTGEALTMNTLVSFIIIFVPICLAILYRINIEEKMLEEFFGDTYRNYKLNTRRIIPFIY